MEADTDGDESADISLVQGGEADITFTQPVICCEIIINLRWSSKFKVCIHDGAQHTNQGENEEIRDRQLDSDRFTPHWMVESTQSTDQQGDETQYRK